MSSSWRCFVTVNDIFIMSLFNLVSQETRSTSIFQSFHVMLLQILLTIFIIIEIHVWSRMIWLSCKIFCNWMIKDHHVLLRFYLLRWRWYSCFMLFNLTRRILMWADDFFFFNEELSHFNSELMFIDWSTFEAEMLNLFKVDINMSFSWVCILLSDFRHFECNDSELSSFSVKITCC